MDDSSLAQGSGFTQATIVQTDISSSPTASPIERDLELKEMLISVDKYFETFNVIYPMLNRTDITILAKRVWTGKRVPDVDCALVYLVVCLGTSLQPDLHLVANDYGQRANKLIPINFEDPNFRIIQCLILRVGFFI